MTEANAEIIADKPDIVTDDAGKTPPPVDKVAEVAKPADTAKPSGEAAKEFVADTTKTDAENDAARVEFDKANVAKDDKTDDKGAMPDNWRELAAGGDEDLLKLAKRYGSSAGILKALKEAQATIRSGKVKTAKPDPANKEAMAEWRKAEGIPDDPTGYTLPDTVKKVMTDADKPMLSSFTEFAHGKGAPQSVIDIGSEWYFTVAEKMAEDQAAGDAEALEAAEDQLRKDWVGPEYKGNMTLAKRYVEAIPGVGASWTEARLPDGRLLGSVPEFVAWASDQGRQQFGDVTFATGDGERKHTARREEIEKIRNTDFERYENEGLDKEYRTLIEKDLARGKR